MNLAARIAKLEVELENRLRAELPSAIIRTARLHSRPSTYGMQNPWNDAAGLWEQSLINVEDTPLTDEEARYVEAGIPLLISRMSANAPQTCAPCLLSLSVR